jgi:hypothetical protein
LHGTFDDAGPVAKLRAEEDVGVGEEVLLERDDDELCAAKACAEERADVVCGTGRAAASISSRMHIGAGLNCRSAMISDSAMSDL